MQLEHRIKLNEQIARESEALAECEGMVSALSWLHQLHSALAARLSALQDASNHTFDVSDELASEISPNQQTWKNGSLTLEALRELVLKEHQVPRRPL